MLDFYGMELCDEKTGALRRASHWKERYNEALLRNTHNHLRITRIMQCLAETGFYDYAEKLSEFLLKEVFGEKFDQLSEYRPATGPLKELANLSSRLTLLFWSVFSPTGQRLFNSDYRDNYGLMMLSKKIGNIDRKQKSIYLEGFKDKVAVENSKLQVTASTKKSIIFSIVGKVWESMSARFEVNIQPPQQLRRFR